MQTQAFGRLNRVAPPRRRNLDGVASEVVARVAAARSAADPICERLMQLLVAAAAGADRIRCGEVHAAARGAGVSDEQFVDLYLPEAARRMGADWLADRMSFARVSIGMAQLQSLLRDIPAAHGLPETATGGDPPAVLMVVPRGEQHVFGARIAAGKLRRGGACVVSLLGPRTGEVAAALARRPVDALMLSAGGAGGLEFCCELIHAIRSDICTHLPIVVGGAAMTWKEEIESYTGADIVSSDPEAALRACLARCADVRVRSSA